MRDAYRALLGYAATDADLDRALQLDENAASANYARFRRDAAR